MRTQFPVMNKTTVFFLGIIICKNDVFQDGSD